MNTPVVTGPVVCARTREVSRWMEPTRHLCKRRVVRCIIDCIHNSTAPGLPKHPPRRPTGLRLGASGPSPRLLSYLSLRKYDPSRLEKKVHRQCAAAAKVGSSTECLSLLITKESRRTSHLGGRKSTSKHTTWRVAHTLFGMLPLGVRGWQRFNPHQWTAGASGTSPGGRAHRPEATQPASRRTRRGRPRSESPTPRPLPRRGGRSSRGRGANACSRRSFRWR